MLRVLGFAFWLDSDDAGVKIEDDYVLVWCGRPLTQKAREKAYFGLVPLECSCGHETTNTLAMAALIEQGVNKGVNKPHSISSTLKVLFPRIPGEWYHSGIG